MKHARALLILASLVASSAWAQDRGLGESDAASVKSEVTAFLRVYTKTVEEGDAAAIRRLYVTDPRFCWFTDGKKSYATPDDILQALARLSASGMSFKTEHTNVRAIPLSRDLASVSMSFQTKATAEKGPGFSFAGVITMLLERSSDGAWRVVTGHTSTAGGPPGAGPKKR